MAFKIIIKPITFADAEEAVIFYEKRLTGLGKRFYNSFLFALEEIQANILIPIFFKYSKVES